MAYVWNFCGEIAIAIDGEAEAQVCVSLEARFLVVLVSRPVDILYGG